MADRIDELLQRKTALSKEARKLVDTTEKEDRALNAGEREQYDKFISDIDALTSRIDVLKEDRSRTRELAEIESRTKDFDPRDVTGDPNENEEERAYKGAFETYLRKGDRGLNSDEVRAMTVGTAASGGYLVTKSFLNTLVKFLELQSPIRRISRIYNTSQGNQVLVPRLTAHVAASWVAEGGAKPLVTPTLDQLALDAWKSALIIQVSKELLDDSAFNVEQLVAEELGEAIGKAEGAAFAVGDGSSKPEGLIPNVTVGKTAASQTAITGDELIDLVYSVNPAYFGNARFLMHPAVVAVIRKLKANSQYIWSDQFTAGQPATLLGFPVEFEPNMDAAPAATDKVIGFGDIRAAYTIREVDGVAVQRLNELYAGNNLVGFLGEHRVDGGVVDANAFKTLQMAA